MTLDELRAAVAAELGGDVFVEAGEQDGKHVVECGVVIPATKRTKRWVKSIVFNAAAIPQNAVEKIARVIA